MQERWIGRSVPRREDRRLLTGAGAFLADRAPAGCLEAAFVRSPLAHGRGLRVEVAAARALPGVAAALTAADLPHTPLVDSVRVDGLARTPQPALATERVRFVGEPIAIVVAVDRYVAEDAADLVDLELEPLPALPNVDVALAAPALLFDDLPANTVYRTTRRWGDVASAFAAADHVVTGRVTTGRVSAAPLEARGCIAEWDPGTGRLTFTSSTQSPHLLRRRLAATTGIPEHRIRVLVPDVGGAFGQKIPCAPEEVAVALAARALARPVRWVEDRRENLVAGPHAKEQHLDIELALADDGRFLGLRTRIVGDAGAYSSNSASALIEPYLAANLMPGVYRLGALEAEVVAVLTTKAPVAPYRGVGWTAGQVARELVIDRAARRLGRDPADLRRQNLVAAGAFPYTSLTGMVYDSGSFTESLDDVLNEVGYAALRARQAEARGRGAPDLDARLLGIGISPYVEPCGWGSEGSLQSQWSFASHDTVRVSVDPDGLATVACGTPSQGQGHETTLAQVVAEVLGVDLDAVEVRSRDTDATPVSTAGTRASRTAVVTGGAARLAAQDVHDRLLQVAGAMLECAPGDLEITGGTVAVRGDPTARLTVREVAMAAHYAPEIRAVVPEPDLSASRFFDPRATYSNGCVVAVVEVDPATGAVTVLRVSAVEDCGTIINPPVVDGQVRGAVAQGLGAAMLESLHYDAEGQLQTATLVDYLLPGAGEVPRITVGHRCSPSPWTAAGVKGMGESGVIATPAAVALAVEDALAHLGVEVSRLPLRPDVVAGLLDAAGVDPTLSPVPLPAA